MKLNLVATILVGLAAACLPAQEIEWAKSLEQARDQAIAEGKLVLLHFAEKSNRDCLQLESYVYSSSLVQSTLRDLVIPVWIDAEERPETVEEFGVIAVPFDVILTPSGEILSKRKCPADAKGYAHMVTQAFNMTRVEADPESESIRRDLIDLQDKLKPDSNRLLDRDFVPDAPSHEMPSVSAESRNLWQRQQASLSRSVRNPYFDSNRSPAESDEPEARREAAGPLTIHNDSQGHSEGWDPGVGREGTEKLVAKQSQPTRIANPTFGRQSADIAAGDSVSIPRPTRGGSAFQSGDFLPPAEKPTSPGNSLRPVASDDLNARAEIATQEQAGPPKTEFALQGKCPVTLISAGKWADGDRRFGATHRGRTYLFADEKCQQEFLSQPDRYSPLLAGYDPVEFYETGKLVDGIEKYGTLMEQDGDQRLVLFQNPENLARFKTQPGQFIRKVIAARQTTDQSNGRIR